MKGIGDSLTMLSKKVQFKRTFTGCGRRLSHQIQFGNRYWHGIKRAKAGKKLKKIVRRAAIFIKFNYEEEYI